MILLKSVFGWLLRGPLDRVFDLVNRRVDSETERQRMKADIVKAHIAGRAGWLRAGGIVTLLIFAVPAALWRGSVYLYSMFFCSVCILPQGWAIGDIPASFREVDMWIVLASIGALGLMTRK